MKKVYICSPYRADTKEGLERHIEYAKEVTRRIALQGCIPVTPHLYLTQCLDDNDPAERAAGMSIALGLIDVCDILIVCDKYGLSEGMQSEIRYAQKQGKFVGYIESTIFI